MLQEYLTKTHGASHDSYTMELEQAFEVEREAEAAAFKAKGEKMANRQLLWHGSRLTNWCGILSSGLRIAPPEAPVTGYMFGKGVYFANMSSKSANYCFANSGQPTGVMVREQLRRRRRLFACGARPCRRSQRRWCPRCPPLARCSPLPSSASRPNT